MTRPTNRTVEQRIREIEEFQRLRKALRSLNSATEDVFRPIEEVIEDDAISLGDITLSEEGELNEIPLEDIDPMHAKMDDLKEVLANLSAISDARTNVDNIAPMMDKVVTARIEFIASITNSRQALTSRIEELRILISEAIKGNEDKKIAGNRIDVAVVLMDELDVELNKLEAMPSIEESDLEMEEIQRLMRLRDENIVAVESIDKVTGVKKPHSKAYDKYYRDASLAIAECLYNNIAVFEKYLFTNDTEEELEKEIEVDNTQREKEVEVSQVDQARSSLLSTIIEYSKTQRTKEAKSQFLELKKEVETENAISRARNEIKIPILQDSKDKLLELEADLTIRIQKTLTTSDEISLKDTEIKKLREKIAQNQKLKLDKVRSLYPQMSQINDSNVDELLQAKMAEAQLNDERLNGNGFFKGLRRLAYKITFRGSKLKDAANQASTLTIMVDDSQKIDQENLETEKQLKILENQISVLKQKKARQEQKEADISSLIKKTELQIKKQEEDITLNDNIIAQNNARISAFQDAIKIDAEEMLELTSPSFSTEDLERIEALKKTSAEFIDQSRTELADFQNKDIVIRYLDKQESKEVKKERLITNATQEIIDLFNFARIVKEKGYDINVGLKRKVTKAVFSVGSAVVPIAGAAVSAVGKAVDKYMAKRQRHENARFVENVESLKDKIADSDEFENIEAYIADVSTKIAQSYANVTDSVLDRVGGTTIDAMSAEIALKISDILTQKDFSLEDVSLEELTTQLVDTVLRAEQRKDATKTAQKIIGKRDVTEISTTGEKYTGKGAIEGVGIEIKYINESGEEVFEKLIPQRRDVAKYGFRQATAAEIEEYKTAKSLEGYGSYIDPETKLQNKMTELFSAFGIDFVTDRDKAKEIRGQIIQMLNDYANGLVIYKQTHERMLPSLSADLSLIKGSISTSTDLKTEEELIAQIQEVAASYNEARNVGVAKHRFDILTSTRKLMKRIGKNSLMGEFELTEEMTDEIEESETELEEAEEVQKEESLSPDLQSTLSEFYSQQKALNELDKFLRRDLSAPETDGVSVRKDANNADLLREEAIFIAQYHASAIIQDPKAAEQLLIESLAFDKGDRKRDLKAKRFGHLVHIVKEMSKLHIQREIDPESVADYVEYNPDHRMNKHNASLEVLYSDLELDIFSPKKAKIGQIVASYSRRMDKFNKEHGSSQMRQFLNSELIDLIQGTSTTLPSASLVLKFRDAIDTYNQANGINPTQDKSAMLGFLAKAGYSLKGKIADSFQNELASFAEHGTDSTLDFIAGISGMKRTEAEEESDKEEDLKEEGEDLTLTEDVQDVLDQETDLSSLSKSELEQQQESLQALREFIADQTSISVANSILTDEAREIIAQDSEEALVVEIASLAQFKHSVIATDPSGIISKQILNSSLFEKGNFTNARKFSADGARDLKRQSFNDLKDIFTRIASTHSAYVDLAQPDTGYQIFDTSLIKYDKEFAKLKTILGVDSTLDATKSEDLKRIISSYGDRLYRNGLDHKDKRLAEFLTNELTTFSGTSLTQAQLDQINKTADSYNVSQGRDTDQYDLELMETLRKAGVKLGAKAIDSELVTKIRDALSDSLANATEDIRKVVHSVAKEVGVEIKVPNPEEAEVEDAISEDGDSVAMSEEGEASLEEDTSELEAEEQEEESVKSLVKRRAIARFSTSDEIIRNANETQANAIEQLTAFLEEQFKLSPQNSILTDNARILANNGRDISDLVEAIVGTAQHESNIIMLDGEKGRKTKFAMSSFFNEGNRGRISKSADMARMDFNYVRGIFVDLANFHQTQQNAKGYVTYDNPDAKLQSAIVILADSLGIDSAVTDNIKALTFAIKDYTKETQEKGEKTDKSLAMLKVKIAGLSSTTTSAIDLKNPELNKAIEAANEAIGIRIAKETAKMLKQGIAGKIAVAIIGDLHDLEMLETKNKIVAAALAKISEKEGASKEDIAEAKRLIKGSKTSQTERLDVLVIKLAHLVKAIPDADLLHSQEDIILAINALSEKIAKDGPDKSVKEDLAALGVVKKGTYSGFTKKGADKWDGNRAIFNSIVAIVSDMSKAYQKESKTQAGQTESTSARIDEEKLPNGTRGALDLLSKTNPTPSPDEVRSSQRITSSVISR